MTNYVMIKNNDMRIMCAEVVVHTLMYYSVTLVSPYKPNLDMKKHQSCQWESEVTLLSESEKDAHDKTRK
jgi:hypothetical protein